MLIRKPQNRDFYQLRINAHTDIRQLLSSFQKKETRKVKGVAKAVGQTPLEALREYGIATGRPDIRRSYAGRLDPMAEGVLAVLEEEACDGQAEAQHTTKRYAWELLLGVSSDSLTCWVF